MAKNGTIGDGHSNGQATNRSQTYNSKNDAWVNAIPKQADLLM